MYSKRKSSIIAPAPLTTKFISKQARLHATKSVLFFFVPIHNSLSNTSARLKLVSVSFSLLVTLRKVSRRASCKALRWDKVNTMSRVCITQYRIVFSFHLAKRINHLHCNRLISATQFLTMFQSPWSGLRQKGTILFAFLKWPLSLWPQEHAPRTESNELGESKIAGELWPGQLDKT